MQEKILLVEDDVPLASIVDFPLPEGPTITKKSPSAISKLIPFIILFIPSKDL